MTILSWSLGSAKYYLISKYVSRYWFIPTTTCGCLNTVHGGQYASGALYIYDSAGLQLLDLVNSDVWGPYITELYEARYYVTFLSDATKRSKPILLKEKIGVHLVFQKYCLRNKKNDKRVWQLREDGGGKYDLEAFAQFREEKGIIWKPIIFGNTQMNGEAESLSQILRCMANALLKDPGFAIRYWPELILTVKYLRNWEPVVSRDIKPFEADTGRPPFLGHMRQIEQIRVA